MLDNPPDNPRDDAGWFRHFRMTKYLPAITGKFDAAMAQTENDATANKAVMTAYAAAAVDILMHLRHPVDHFAADLGKHFHLTPQHFLLLDMDDIARLSGRSRITLGETLADAGFLVNGDTVAGFRLPRDAQRPPRVFHPPKP
jgi:hypothetical protein